MGALPVTQVADGAFEHAFSVTAVAVPEGVTNIGKKAFNDCTSMSSLSLPSTLQAIGASAFYTCSSLTEVSIPSSVTALGDYAFFGCLSLTSASIPGSLRDWGAATFAYCGNLQSVTIGDGAAEVPERTFKACTSLATVGLPSSVKTIARRAFEKTVVSECDLSSVVSIGYRAFVPDNYGRMTDLDLASVQTIDDEAFCGQSKLARVSMPAVVSIGKNAFKDAFGTEAAGIRLELPASLERLDEGAFAGCTAALAAIDVDAGCAAYRSTSGAVYTADGSTLVAVPAGWDGDTFTVAEGTSRIGALAFSNCQKIQRVVLPDTVAELGEAAFKGTGSLQEIELPAGLVHPRRGLLGLGHRVGGDTLERGQHRQERLLPVRQSLERLHRGRPAGCRLVRLRQLLEPRRGASSKLGHVGRPDGLPIQLHRRLARRGRLAQARGQKPSFRRRDEAPRRLQRLRRRFGDLHHPRGRRDHLRVRAGRPHRREDRRPRFRVEHRGARHRLFPRPRRQREVQPRVQALRQRRQRGPGGLCEEERPRALLRGPAALVHRAFALGRPDRLLRPQGGRRGRGLLRELRQQRGEHLVRRHRHSRGGRRGGRLREHGPLLLLRARDRVRHARRRPVRLLHAGQDHGRGARLGRRRDRLQPGASPSSASTPSAYLYTSDNYPAINALLEPSGFAAAADAAYGQGEYGEFEGVGRNAAAELARYKVHEDVLVYSGLEDDEFIPGGGVDLSNACALIGKEVTFKPILSTSLVETIAKEFLYGNDARIMLLVYVPKDSTQGALIGEASAAGSECEVTFAAGTKFRVVDAGVRYAPNYQFDSDTYEGFYPQRFMKLVPVSEGEDGSDAGGASGDTGASTQGSGVPLIVGCAVAGVAAAAAVAAVVARRRKKRA